MKSLFWEFTGILLGIIIGLLSGYAIIQYSAQSSNATLRDSITNLEKQKNETQTKLDSLQGTNANLKQANEHLQQANADLEVENANLQNNNTALITKNTALIIETANLKVLTSQVTIPRLATRLGSRNCDWDSNDLRLYIQGEVWNVGATAARNCSLHVTLYSGNFTALETYLQIGSIPSGTCEDVAENVHYSGFTLTDWTIVPECNP